jgi:hypothetical protein
MRALWLADVLRQAGLPVVEVAGWRERGGSLFAPSMVFMHHDASPTTASEAEMVNVVTHGRAGLPGPIGNVYIGRSCTVYVIASGKSNHAGTGKVTLANQRSIGIEVGNNGVGEPWSVELTDIYRRVVLALCGKLGVGVDRVYTHAAHTSRKIDPAGPTTVRGLGPGTWNLDNVRAWLAQSAPVTPPTPAPIPLEDDDMAPEFLKDNVSLDVWMVGYGNNTWMRNEQVLANFQNFHAARLKRPLSDFAVRTIGVAEMDCIRNAGVKP